MKRTRAKILAQRSIRRHLVAGLAAVFVLVGGIGGWAATTQFVGAVIAPGLLVVESDIKKVQHPTGGVVAELNVREGDTVLAGDVLLRLDDTVTKANLAVIVNSLSQLMARQARLEAERDGTDTVTFPDDLMTQSSDPEIERLMAGERSLFTLRRHAREGQKAQLSERISQLKEETGGIVSQIEAKGRELSLIEQELEGVRALREKALVPMQRVNALDREAARLEGERGQLVSSAAQAKGRMTEIELQIIQIDQDLRSEVAADLREIHAKTAELHERKIAAEDQLQRVDLHAPQNGRVFELAVHTVGGVAGAGEVLMFIVPVSDVLAIEVRIAPQDIDQVRVGQPATLRFSAFNQRTTPELSGKVTLLSANLTTDDRTGLTYYTGRLVLNEGQLTRLDGLILTPGMPVEAFIKTHERTVLSYLTKPMADHVMRSFRGE